MSEFIKKQEFDKLYLPYNVHDKQIWVISRVKQLPSVIVKMAISLANLDFIKYIRVCDETLSASSENFPKRPKVPIVKSNHKTAIGIEILYYNLDKTINFYEINSPLKGNGGKMVEAVLKELPKDWQPAIIMDWSDGFWDKMESKYKQFNWIR